MFGKNLSKPITINLDDDSHFCHASPASKCPLLYHMIITAPQCYLEKFLSEVEQVGAASNTRGDAKDSDRGEESRSDPGYPYLGGPVGSP